MEIGMLWFDNDPSQSFQNKVKRASAYYQKKYGKVPDICFVHPSMVEEGIREGAQPKVEAQLGDLHVEWSERVLPHHFWIGVRNGEE